VKTCKALWAQGQRRVMYVQTRLLPDSSDPVHGHVVPACQFFYAAADLRRSRETELVNIPTIEHSALNQGIVQSDEGRMPRQARIGDVSAAFARLKDMAEILQQTVGNVDGGVRHACQTSPEQDGRNGPFKAGAHIIQQAGMGAMLPLQ